MPSFNETKNPTPLGIYDRFSLFQSDCNAAVTFVCRTLGIDFLSTEITRKVIWSQFERATRQLNGLLVEYQAISNISSLLGLPTGSLDANGNSNINLSDIYVQQTLEFMDALAAPYASFIGYGQAYGSLSGSIALENGKQDYDIYTDLKTEDGTLIYDLQPSGSIGKLRVYEVFHYAPISYLYNSNLNNNGNFVGVDATAQGNFPDGRFHVLPVYEDVLRASNLDTAQKVRRSQYSYRVSGRNIRIYPKPTNIAETGTNKLWLRVGFNQSPVPSLQNTLLASGSASGPNSLTSANFPNQVLFGANSPANIPYGPLNYNSLNIWARNWIAELTLAYCTIYIGRIRSKMKSFPVPGGELSLNGDDLITQGQAEVERLLTGMKESFMNMTYDKIQEREASKAENTVKQLSYVPMPAKYTIKLWE